MHRTNRGDKFTATKWTEKQVNGGEDDNNLRGTRAFEHNKRLNSQLLTYVYIRTALDPWSSLTGDETRLRRRSVGRWLFKWRMGSGERQQVSGAALNDRQERTFNSSPKDESFIIIAQRIIKIANYGCGNGSRAFLAKEN